MKLAITGTMEADENTPVVLRGDYRDIISEAARIGYDGVELHIKDYQEIDRDNLKKNFEDNGITLSSIGTGAAYAEDGLSLSSEDQSIREQAVERVNEHIITAKDYKAVVIIGLMKGLVSDYGDRQSFKDNLKKSLVESLKEAEKHDVILGLEVINRYESDIFNTIEEGLEFIEEFESEYLKLHIDTYHMNIEEPDYTSGIFQAKDKIGHVHIADSDRWYAGHGHYNFEETIKALSDIDYDGYLAVESLYHPRPSVSAEKSYENLKNMLNSLK